MVELICSQPIPPSIYRFYISKEGFLLDQKENMNRRLNL
jgi:hypothetical protein